MENHLKTLFAQFLSQATPQQLTHELTAAKAKIEEKETELETAKENEEIEEIREILAYEKEVLAMVEVTIDRQLSKESDKP